MARAINLLVYVRDSDVEGAIKLLKKKFQTTLKRDIARHAAYVKPGEAARTKSTRARRRERKHARRMAAHPMSRHDLRDMASGGYY